MWAQILQDSCLSSGWRARIARRVRRSRLRFGDPEINYKIGAADLTIPMSHMLPIYRRDYASYLSNFSRIIEELSLKWPQLRVIDIGANVGDTLALIREANPNAAVLCVEGNPDYLKFLSKNAAKFDSGVFIEQSYLGSGATFAGVISQNEGTAHLEERPDAGVLQTITLEQLIGRHPDFGLPHFIKIDTDGFDARILDACTNFLGLHGPLVFAEVDPKMTREAGQDWLETIQSLVEQGYTDSIWWSNVGRMVCRFDLTNAGIVADLLHFQPGGHTYSDVLFGRAEHLEFMNAMRDRELRCA